MKAITTRQAISVLRRAYRQAIERGDTDVTIPANVIFLILRYRCNKERTPKPYAEELDWTPPEWQFPSDQ